MLCPQSRQNCAQSSHSLISLFLVICAFLTSCIGGSHVPSEAELSEFGNYVNEMDSSLKGSWFTRMGVSPDADSMLVYLRRELPRHGLDSSAFFIQEIASDLQIVRSLAFDSVGLSINDILPRLDRNLSKAFVCYTTGQRYGFMNPEAAFNKLSYKSSGDGYARLFDYEVKSADSTESVQKMGIEGSRMAYLMESYPKSSVYLALQKELVKTTDSAARHKLAVNMERCRWQIKQPGESEKMVLVNIPALQLWAVGGDSVLPMRICCGAVSTKTPLLHSEISYVQVNPEWVIPHNIVRSEVAHHGGDSSYFARHRYYIIQRSTGDTLSASNVTSGQLASGNYRVAQRGGVGNSLGRIVFRFPNNFSVYLHDTSNRGAFNSDHRTLSHGCVRVQKPFDLACFLMPEMDAWQRDQLRISMDIPPQTEQGRNYLHTHANAPRPFRLMTFRYVEPKVPLYIIYYTAYPTPGTGVVETWPDLYGYDKVITRATEPYLLK